MERPKLDEWFEETDKVLMEQGQILDALKKVVKENGLDNGYVDEKEPTYCETAFSIWFL